jgi:hypothetical protein
MAKDRFTDTQADFPARSAWAITPSDNPVGDAVPRAIWVGTGGSIQGRLVGDAADVTFVNVPDGTLLPVRFEIIRAATTASNILGLI